MENTENFGQDGRYLRRVLSTGLIIYEEGVLIILGRLFLNCLLLYLMKLVELCKLRKHGMN